MKQTALITGITGQIGSYLAEELLKYNYTVYGLFRQSSTPNYWRIQHLLHRVNFVCGDITDPASMNNTISALKPDVVFNLAAQSFVGESWNQPYWTTMVNAIGPLNILEAIRKYSHKTRFYQQSTSEMFGKVQEIPQKETTPFYPRSPYGVAKLAAHWTAKNYRESYGMFISTGILFNVESPRRTEQFVTRKITTFIGKLMNMEHTLRSSQKLQLGNINTQRDWGYAADAARAIRMIAEHNEPDDFVIATERTYSVKEFLQIAFSEVGLTWQDYVKIDESLIRPAEVELLLGDASKIRRTLGWKPTITFQELVQMMVNADIIAQRNNV